MECFLCSLRGKTKLLHDDSICMIVDCAECDGTPLAVLKRHTDKPSREERDHMFRSLRKVAEARYGRDEFFLDETTKEHEGHYHVHARRL